MTLSPEEFLIVAQSLCEIAAGIPECGYVNVSPISFVDKADFQANIGASAMNTQKRIETTQIALTTLTLSKPPRKPETHGEAWEYTFNFNVFRETGKTRLDETNTPDAFRKKVLKSYYDFLSAVMNLQAAFGSEEMPIAGLPETIIEAVAELGSEDGIIAENEPCRYLETVGGFSTDIEILVSITFAEC